MTIYRACSWVDEIRWITYLDRKAQANFSISSQSFLGRACWRAAYISSTHLSGMADLIYLCWQCRSDLLISIIEEHSRLSNPLWDAALAELVLPSPVFLQRSMKAVLTMRAARLYMQYQETYANIIPINMKAVLTCEHWLIGYAMIVLKVPGVILRLHSE